MIDYLELQAGEEELDLWEAARRLDDVLARLEVGGESARRMGETDAQDAGTGVKPVRGAEETGESGGETDALPLLEEAERMDRALEQVQALERGKRPSASAEELTAWEREAVRSWLSGTGRSMPALVREEPLDGPAGRAPMGASSVSPMDWGTETAQAERLDLLFRRDSRRYDGGFFLY